MRGSWLNLRPSSDGFAVPGRPLYSNTIVRTLRDAAHEAVRLRDVLPVESPDTMVIAKAQEMDAILLSMNGDFADIVTYPPKNYKGIVALQMRNHAEVLDPLMRRLIGYLKVQPGMEHFRGKLVVVEGNRIRIRQ
jgi:predicted nuclease of predicted toxin-antitoxin system